MNRGVLQSFPVQQMMGGNLNFWTVNSMRSPSQQSSPLLPPPSIFPQYTPAASSLPSGSCHEIQELPESWNQLLVSGFVGEEERYNFKQLVAKKAGNWDNHVLCPSSLSMVDVKPEVHAASTPWSAQNLQPSSPRSCVSTNMLDFSNSVEGKHQKQDNLPECNSTATAVAYKKPRIQPPSQPMFKVRKEKLGDRITALHQLVSPFGKTDTASVLLEAIEYIRFLQSQIEALSSPYLGNGSGNMRQTVQGERNCIFPEDPGQLSNDARGKRRRAHEKDGRDEPKKDLRSRGLCLVPVSCTEQVGSDNGADLWAPSLGGGF